MTKILHFAISKPVLRSFAWGGLFYVRFVLSPCNVEDLFRERSIDVSHETVRFWWEQFGPMFASEIVRKRRN
jgi:putative transposase